ncbi:hypothetical protein CspeluHIS016_0500890 [Cutaneotrichosporon spelunceum]|uniref:Uncharacterized protein n=1 Tax=Cutaneotrichosporon spelunceum TaxID=1672016 RepID=A0AAD3YDK7_9TREE|nr:hypothetical protein CspeluHIS016_0500890 [Cutaneotrichosporon spelunceum]
MSRNPFCLPHMASQEESTRLDIRSVRSRSQRPTSRHERSDRSAAPDGRNGPSSEQTHVYTFATNQPDPSDPPTPPAIPAHLVYTYRNPLQLVVEAAEADGSEDGSSLVTTAAVVGSPSPQEPLSLHAPLSNHAGSNHARSNPRCGMSSNEHSPPISLATDTNSSGPILPRQFAGRMVPVLTPCQPPAQHPSPNRYSLRYPPLSPGSSAPSSEQAPQALESPEGSQPRPLLLHPQPRRIVPLPSFPRTPVPPYHTVDPPYHTVDPQPPAIITRYRASLACTTVAGRPLLAALLWGPNGRPERRALMDALRRVAPDLDLDLDARVAHVLANETLWAASVAIEGILVECVNRPAESERGERGARTRRGRWTRWRRRTLCCLDLEPVPT